MGSIRKHISTGWGGGSRLLLLRGRAWVALRTQCPRAVERPCNVLEHTLHTTESVAQAAYVLFTRCFSQGVLCPWQRVCIGRPDAEAVRMPSGQ